MRRVYNVGINNAEYPVYRRDGGLRIMCPAYRTWKAMLQRAYDPKMHARLPTYSDVTVAKEWHYFRKFKAWYDENYVDGWQLDKDLLFNDLEYSPLTCLFVPTWLNCFTVDCRSARGKWPIGVSWHKKANKYQARCWNHISGKRENLGYFSSPKCAHRAWLNRKVDIAYQLKDLMDAIDKRIYFRVIENIFMK